MRNTKSNNNNIFNGPVSFNGPAQVIGGNIIGGGQNQQLKKARYKSKPIWRSPLTLSVLSWTSVILGIVSLIPIGQILRNIISFFNGNIQQVMDSQIHLNMFFMVIVLFLFALVCSLIRITKKQIREPLIFNYAINGMKQRIVVEKIIIDECPICGGKMKYYNKPIEWRKNYVNGKEKWEVIKKIPVLECKRNNEHCFKVDPAEERITK